MKYKDHRNVEFRSKYKDYADFLKKIEPLLYKAEAIQDDNLIYIIKLFSGLLPNQAIKTEEVYGIGKVDSGIADIIKRMNKIHIRTLASCSGLEDDHKEGCYSSGYISLEDTQESRKFIEDLCKTYEQECIFEPELNYTYFVESIIIHLKSSEAIDILRKFILDYN